MTKEKSADYNALLDEHEDACTLDCGCQMSRQYGELGVAIKFCPLHDNAAELYAAALDVCKDFKPARLSAVLALIRGKKRPANCECDNTHEQNRTCCQPCWNAGFRVVAEKAAS